MTEKTPSEEADLHPACPRRARRVKYCWLFGFPALIGLVLITHYFVLRRSAIAIVSPDSGEMAAKHQVPPERAHELAIHYAKKRGIPTPSLNGAFVDRDGYFFPRYWGRKFRYLDEGFRVDGQNGDVSYIAQQTYYRVRENRNVYDSPFWFW